MSSPYENIIEQAAELLSPPVVSLTASFTKSIEQKN